MIDLHTHTTESDGTFTPTELVDAAVTAGLEALAITDHDTISGYEAALPHARDLGLRLICGIEISTALGNPRVRTVHILGYFPAGLPSSQFLEWLSGMQAARHDRNVRMAERLRSLGANIHVEEVRALGRTLAGRPHFARLLVSKGYCANMTEAFSRYLDESAPGYVQREEPSLEEGVRRILDGGGVPSLAHPIRLGKRDPAEEEALIAGMCDASLRAIEAYHSDHSPADMQRYLAIGRKYGLLITGGSDFHGDNKPSIRLGTGHDNNLNVPASLLRPLLG